MAEGGGEFDYKDPDLDNRLDHDDSDSGQEVNAFFNAGPFHKLAILFEHNFIC